VKTGGWSARMIQYGSQLSDVSDEIARISSLCGGEQQQQQQQRTTRQPLKTSCNLPLS